MITSFSLLFRPLSDHASLWIKGKPYNRLNIKWEEISSQFSVKMIVCFFFKREWDNFPFYTKTIVWFFFSSKRCIVWWWPEQKAETSNNCNWMMVFLHDIIFDKYRGGLVHDKDGPCHHDMAHPKVVIVGTAFNMEGSSEYIE